ncbi:MAG TPA: hypothetical protein VL754_03730 [Verrucomicrobiae bacterium]|nr:hypothetical protein [Verrucomicrobiae bacterium]
MRKRILAVTAGALLSACMPGEIPKEALKFADETPAERRLESRSFATEDEAKLLGDGAAVLKELGFTVDTRSDELGFVGATKKASAYNVGEIAVSAATAVIAQAAGLGLSMPPYSKDQSLRAALVVTPAEDGGGLIVRITLQRVVWDTEGKVSRSELLSDPAPYTEFFAKLAKTSGLDAHEL